MEDYVNPFRTLELATQTYKLCSKLKLPLHLRDQILRASSSVALNLAEGRGRRTLKEQSHFFSISYGSIKEVQAILQLAELETSECFKLADMTGASVYKLIKNLR